MKTVQSADGTTIAFDQLGKGPALILVNGALGQRAMDSETTQLAPLLAEHFTVFHYDRRGRGDSTDTQPYAVEREIEDIEALITEAGGSAFLFGISSGAALAMEAAIKLGDKVKKLAMYEAPYNDDEAARQAVELGGKICLPMVDVPGACRFCGITSPQGVEFRVVQYTS